MGNMKTFIAAARKAKRKIDAWRMRTKAKAEARKAFSYDRHLFSKHAGALNENDAGASEAEIIMAYHVLEKGLTMPNSRQGFGKERVKHLINLIESFEKRFGKSSQVEHASGVVKAYGQKNQADIDSFPELKRFLDQHKSTHAAIEPHVTKQEFFANKDAPFPLFASSRHMVRHFAKPIPPELLMKAVQIASSAPSACNRQPARVHIIADKQAKEKILALQGGSRGFGTSADKLLMITASLKSIRWGWERHDPYTNGGIFAMNLCYALHYCGIAHCILHWSVSPSVDRQARSLLGIPSHEAIVLMIACALPPDEFDIAASPRMSAQEIAKWHGGDAN